MLAMRCTVATNCDRICSVADTCGLVLRLQTWRSITNGRSESHLKPEKGPEYQTREHADCSEVLARDGGI